MQKQRFQFNWPVFFVGVLGGLVPFLLEIGEMLKGGQKMDLARAFLYLGSIPLFGIVGGIVASVLQDKRLRAIFISGAAAPFILKGMVGQYIKGDSVKVMGNQIIAKSDMCTQTDTGTAGTNVIAGETKPMENQKL